MLKNLYEWNIYFILWIPSYRHEENCKMAHDGVGNQRTVSAHLGVWGPVDVMEFDKPRLFSSSQMNQLIAFGSSFSIIMLFIIKYKCKTKHKCESHNVDLSLNVEVQQHI